jgi:hypothetical protein
MASLAPEFPISAPAAMRRVRVHETGSLWLSRRNTCGSHETGVARNSPLLAL